VPHTEPYAHPSRRQPSSCKVEIFVNASPPVKVVSPIWISYPSSVQPSRSAQNPSLHVIVPSALVLRFRPVNIVRTGSKPSPSIVRGIPSPASDPAGSTRMSPSIWYPPQIPMTGTPRPAALWIFAARPLSFSHFRSAIVFLVPGKMTRSGVPNSSVRLTYRTENASTQESAPKSVKLEILGNRITAISTAPFPFFEIRRSDRLSSSSISSFK